MIRVPILMQIKEAKNVNKKANKKAENANKNVSKLGYNCHLELQKMDFPGVFCCSKLKTSLA